ncbi:hypothetical protein [Thiolapillus brandeum]|uniref:Surface antigen domain-containing protein n=1 Tax=Thiolapillus brandeum TaxID=1076588 RepID=A0A7U6GJG4_9GAMM|nr:hypothetical protein [Thiolapillus brandeum]BAO44747.1 hypothetical protein TBH_C1831 [Thiolapillus brandeum]
MKRTTHFLLILILSVLSLTCQASNWQWLHNSNLDDLSDADWAVLSQTLQDALNTAKDGETRHWSNLKSGRQGDIMILDTLHDTEMPCRRVRFSPNENGSPLTFCKGSGEAWLIHSPSAEK